MSGPWSPTPCRLVLKLLFVHESRVCMTVLFQCKLWLLRELPALFISQSPAHHRVYRDARSRDRERGPSKLSGVDALYMYMFILRDPIGSFSDWQRYGPARAHSGAPLFFQSHENRLTDTLFFHVFFVFFSGGSWHHLASPKIARKSAHT